MPPTPVPETGELFFAIDWDHIPDNALAALVATERRGAGQPLGAASVATSSASAVQDIHLWLVEHHRHFGEVFSCVMADRHRRGLVAFAD